MPLNATDQILALAQAHGLLRAADLRHRGLHPQLLIKLAQSGRLLRVARGVYSLPDRPLTEHHMLADVCARVPKAVVCLLSALHVHEIGTQQPFEVWIALPEGTKAPELAYPALRITRLRGAAYTEGMETIMENGAPIRIYSAAKTVADCFKFRNKIGLDVALEALRDVWWQRKASADELGRYARVNRMERVMRPYLQSLAG